MNSTVSRFWAGFKRYSNAHLPKISFGPFQKTIDVKPIEFSAEGLKGIGEIDVRDKNPLAIYANAGTQKISAERAMSHYTGWVYAALKAIADDFSAVQWRLFQVDAQGNHIEQFDHELLDLLDGVNEFQTGMELKYLSILHYEMVGNVYWLLQGVKNPTDKPTSIFVLNPAKVEVVLDKTIYPYTVKSYKLKDENKEWEYKPYQILHFKNPDPNNPYEGVGTLQSVAEWIDIDNYATAFIRYFFENGANFDGVFETEYIDEAQLLSLKITSESAHQGVDNAHKNAFLPKGVKYKQTQASFKDMGVTAMGDSSRDKILAAFKTAKTILGTAESDTNRSTAETADYVFAKRTIAPRVKMFCATINEFLVPRFGDNLYVSFVDPTPEDKEFKTKEMQAVVDNQPVMTVNEARENYLGLGPVQGADTLMSPTTMVGIGEPSDTQKKPVPNKVMARPMVTRAARNYKARKKMAEESASAIVAKVKEIAELRTKNWSKMTRDEFYYVWKDFESRVAEESKPVEGAIKKINKEQEKEVLENLTTLFKKSIGNMFDMNKWMGISVDALTPLLETIAKEEGNQAFAGLGQPAQDILLDEGTKAGLDNAIKLLSKKYNQTTLDQLAEKLTEAKKAGASLADATELVKGIYSFADVTRAAMVAKTETFRMGNYAQRMAMEQSGVVKSIKWHAMADACVFCQALDGKVVSIDDNFANLGDSVRAADGTEFNVDYSDVGAPPLHPNCNCILQPEDINID